MCSWLFSGYHTARLLMSSGYEQEKYMYIHNKRGPGAGPTTSKQQKEKNQLLEHCRAPFFPTDCTRKSMTFLPHLLIFRKEILSFIIECEAQISSIHRGFIYYQGVWRRGTVEPTAEDLCGQVYCLLWKTSLSKHIIRNGLSLQLRPPVWRQVKNGDVFSPAEPLCANLKLTGWTSV